MDGDKTRVIRVLEIGLNPSADLSDTLQLTKFRYDTKMLNVRSKTNEKMLKCNKNVTYV